MRRKTAALLVLASAFLLSILGLFLVYSASHRIYNYWLVLRQGVWLVIGLLSAIAISYVRPARLYRYRWGFYIIGLVLLILTLVFGETIRGGTSWLALGPANLQSSEIMKVFLIMVLAGVAEKIEVGEFNFASGLLAIFGIVILPVGLIILQPDLGTSLIYLALLVGWMFAGGWWREGSALIISGLGLIGALILVILPGWSGGGLVNLVGGELGVIQVFIWVGAGIMFFITAVFPYLRGNRISTVGICILAGLAFLLGLSLVSALAPYQVERIESFFAPARSARTSGYSLLQSQIAIGAGGWTGQGYMSGTQSQLGFIPELWTDFVFTVGVEELGFIFAGVVTLLFMSLVYGVFSAAALAEDWWSYYLCVGIGLIWIFHIFVNVGMCVGLMPVVGLPLPLLSYGGSFMVTNWLMIGVFLSLIIYPR